jgi:hypothetical protein
MIQRSELLKIARRCSPLSRDRLNKLDRTSSNSVSNSLNEIFRNGRRGRDGIMSSSGPKALNGLAHIETCCVSNKQSSESTFLRTKSNASLCYASSVCGRCLRRSSSGLFLSRRYPCHFHLGSWQTRKNRTVDRTRRGYYLCLGVERNPVWGQRYWKLREGRGCA